MLQISLYVCGVFLHFSREIIDNLFFFLIVRVLYLCKHSSDLHNRLHLGNLVCVPTLTV